LNFDAALIHSLTPTNTNMTNTDITIAPAPAHSITAFSNAASFESAQRMALALVSSNIVPEQYRGKDNIGNAIVALEMAQRIGASPLAVMQNLNIIHGRPSWSSTFIIAALNSCGRFAPVRFEVTGEGDDRSCIAWTTDKTGERLEGPPASIAMAKAEGWFTKNGSKWKTMPELMLRYRAAAFFGRLYAPDVLNGMHATEEVEDIGDHPRNVTARTESAILDDAPAPVIEPPAPKPAKAKAKPAVVDIEPEPDPYVEQARKAAENTQERDAARKVAPPATDDGDIFG
jgi:hypothetical protein